MNTEERTDDEAVAPTPTVHMDGVLLAPAAVLEGLPDAVVVTSPDGRIVFTNGLAGELFGYPADELVGQPVHILWPERFRDRYRLNLHRYFATEGRMRFSTEVWGVRRDGTEFAGEMSWGVIATSAGPLLMAIGRDVSGRRAAEERLHAVLALGGRALAGADAVSLAADAAELLRTRLPVAGAEVRLAGGVVLASAGPVSEPSRRYAIGAENLLVLSAEVPLGQEDVDLIQGVADILTIGLERLRGEALARHQAVHDPLTGLANRTLLRDRLEHAVAKARRSGQTTAVLFVDLDRFKEINDDLGHAAGDAVLVEVAARLRAAVRPADTVARFGGDEFVAVCEDLEAKAAIEIAQRFLASMQVPFVVTGGERHVSVSVGVAIGRDRSEQLLADADQAAYLAKTNGRARVELAGRPG